MHSIKSYRQAANTCLQAMRIVNIRLTGEKTMNNKTLKPARYLAVPLAAISIIISGCSGSNETVKNNEVKQETENLFTIKDGEAVITKSTNNNPIFGNDNTGNYIYGGDPSVLTDGDTIYLYTGHDMSSDSEVSRAVYNIPEYLCYSTTNLSDWKEEGTVFTLNTDNVKWAKDSSTAWASQVIKYKDKYYLYFCSWDKTSLGKQSIGVAVSDSPTGRFKDIGRPLVQGILTSPENSAWDDIDPTVWVETDGSGTEHRYLAWGNSKFYICELNEDMISVKDLDGDGKITCGTQTDNADIINNQDGLESFTEAPWIYRRQDENNKYYGDYYLFLCLWLA